MQLIPARLPRDAQRPRLTGLIRSLMLKAETLGAGRTTQVTNRLLQSSGSLRASY